MHAPSYTRDKRAGKTQSSVGHHRAREQRLNAIKRVLNLAVSAVGEIFGKKMRATKIANFETLAMRCHKRAAGGNTKPTKTASRVEANE